MKKDINSFWYDKWTNEKQIKSTLEYLEIQQNPIGTPHNILRSVKNRKYTDYRTKWAAYANHLGLHLI
jgi:hypothetical protein